MSPGEKLAVKQITKTTDFNRLPSADRISAASRKYGDAIEACGDMAYIEFNISQIARILGLNPTGLSSQLRVHYPDIIPMREALRERPGIADRLHCGPLPASRSAYEDAVSVYRFRRRSTQNKKHTTQNAIYDS